MSAAGTAPAPEAVSSKDAPLRATTTASSTADCKAEKLTAKPRETHHLDASATSRTPPLNGAAPAAKVAEPDQPAAQRKENGSALDSGHTLAAKQVAAPSHLEVMSAVDRPPSRPMSPALVQSSAGPRRASSQARHAPSEALFVCKLPAHRMLHFDGHQSGHAADKQGDLCYLAAGRSHDCRAGPAVVLC